MPGEFQKSKKSDKIFTPACCENHFRKGNPVEETAELGEVTAHSDRPGYEPISSTLWRQREDYCARLIQGAWRRRGLPVPPGEIFGSGLGSRSVLDAVLEEDHDELSNDSDDNDEIEEEPEQPLQPLAGSGSVGHPTILVHSRSSSVSSSSIV